MSATDAPTGEQLLSVYRTMLVSRAFDEECMRRLDRGEVVPHFHSGVGQEALMVASVAPLRPEDQIIYTHRGYGHLLAKGVSVLEIALDTYNKTGGTTEGLGGLMHVNRPDLGIPGREGVFGTRFGVAAGLALAEQLRGTDGVCVCFYGEAAGARGPLYEALNMSKLWELPVVFVAENNGWSFTSRTEWLYPTRRMSDAWTGFVDVEVVDGNDPEAVWSAVTSSVERVRAQGGPAVVEGMTYRLDPHIWWDDASYQPDAEIAAWRERDPVPATRRRLTELGFASDLLDDLETSARAEVADAFERADAAPEATWDTARERGMV
ncbi:MAG TPA: thiamine pyrophosphate-dependent dehydrogenase E1 component subunit alpha [Baekduia sp.]|uniref:thiamine pyrophosphate-dependent dehydrogenase E1 component subunit alpha n=1 Tax=Baekduia sp. TaxID=2600305 RepID=UPI002D79C71E|nr:thiamine pyrophosphate-dependent dehydrogenase E1 component subunit alpha [Baekduia sp.]HET6509888.1 thiamine pyrophosphate-dependent dehydrogenase E1 component subunit alpha [Baekduia sp.]